MLHHYFLPKTVERILEILDIYSDDTIPNPDITRESYEVVIAIAFTASRFLLFKTLILFEILPEVRHYVILKI